MIAHVLGCERRPGACADAGGGGGAVVHHPTGTQGGRSRHDCSPRSSRAGPSGSAARISPPCAARSKEPATDCRGPGARGAWGYAVGHEGGQAHTHNRASRQAATPTLSPACRPAAAPRVDQHLVQKAVARAGLDPAPYSAHSLRAGFVTYAHLRGASDRAIGPPDPPLVPGHPRADSVRVQLAWTDNAATHPRAVGPRRPDRPPHRSGSRAGLTEPRRWLAVPGIRVTDARCEKSCRHTASPGRSGPDASADSAGPSRPGGQAQAALPPGLLVTAGAARLGWLQRMRRLVALPRSVRGDNIGRQPPRGHRR